jgi:hypothetical protein
MHEKNPVLNLGGEKAEVFIALTEQTFLAMVTLIDLIESLQFAQNILSKVDDSELVERFTEDVTNFKLFRQIWLRAC